MICDWSAGSLLVAMLIVRARSSCASSLGPVKSINVLPSGSWSPLARTWWATRWPLTKVPLELCRSATAVIVWNALLFAGLHIIYPDLAISLPLIFAGGLGFASLYYVYPNLFLVSASHVVLNFFALLYCFFSFTSLCQE